jgi:hypothetical protein
MKKVILLKTLFVGSLSLLLISCTDNKRNNAGETTGNNSEITSGNRSPAGVNNNYDNQGGDKQNSEKNMEGTMENDSTNTNK